MSLRSSKASFVFITALAMAIGAGVSGCGGDDEDEAASCSACPASASSECGNLASECAGSGESSATCQDAVDAFCALASGLGDAGLIIGGDSGAPPPTGDSGAPPPGDGG